MAYDRDRKKGGVGALPDTLLRARGQIATDNAIPEVPPNAPITSGRLGAGVPLDIQREDRVKEQDKDGQIGTKTIPLGVESVYDARPINARDFLHTTELGIVYDVEQDIYQGEVSYTVPAGYYGVWRSFSVEPARMVIFAGSEVTSGNSLRSVTYTLLTNGNVVPDYEGMLLGQTVERFALDTFVLANELETFTVRLRLSTALALTVETDPVRYIVSFYGQNLLTRGLPKAFQIASQRQTGNIRT